MTRLFGGKYLLACQVGKMGVIEELRQLLEDNSNVDVCFNSNGIKVGAKGTEMTTWKRLIWDNLSISQLRKVVNDIPGERAVQRRKPQQVRQQASGKPVDESKWGFRLMEDADIDAVGARVSRVCKKKTIRRKTSKSIGRKSASRSKSTTRRRRSNSKKSTGRKSRNNSRRRSSYGKTSRAARDYVAYKIPLLIDEGYPRKQAVAIAFSMYEQKRRRK